MAEELDPAIEFRQSLRYTHANRKWLRSITIDPELPDIAASIVVYEDAGEINTQSLTDESAIEPETLQLIRQQNAHLR